MGLEHIAYAYSAYRFIPSSLWPTYARYTLEELCELNLLYVPKIPPFSTEFVEETENTIIVPLVPKNAWNGTRLK